MSHLIKLVHEEYEEFWIDLDCVVSIGIGTAMIQQGPVVVPAKGCVVVTTSGQKLLFSIDKFEFLLKAKLEGEGGSPKDIDIPPGILNAWKDPKGDDDEGKQRA